MKKHWYIIIVAVIGWVAIVVAELLGASIPQQVGTSIKLILTTVLTIGVAIPFVESAIEASGKTIADAIFKFQPDIEKGFSRVADTIQKFELTSELRDLRRYLPHQVKYLQHSRTYFLEPEGNAIVLSEYIVKNISDRKLDRIVLPIFGFGLGGEYDKTKSYDELLELSIDGARIDTNINAIRTLYLRSTPDIVEDVKQSHMIECCYRVPVSLGEGQTVRISLKTKNLGFAVPMYDVDYVGARIYDITEKLIITAVAPKDHVIRVMPTTYLQKGFIVFHIPTEDEQADELARITSPKIHDGREVYWSVDFPLIGYTYAARYQVQKPGVLAIAARQPSGRDR
jgi:hypothetical protein